MAELTDFTVSPSFTRPFSVQLEPAADGHIEALEAALHCITPVPAGAAPPVIELAHRTLLDLNGFRLDSRLVAISSHIACDFRLHPRDLQSTCREQRIAFVRQLAMFLCRKITGAPFTSIGRYFHRHHSTVIHAYQLIERRVRRDVAFRLFIEKLTRWITRMVQATAI
jgi:chromosomal replication initiator protein